MQNIKENTKAAKMQELNHRICILDIIALKSKIPHTIKIQKSHVINYKNKVFYPKIFLTKYDYYNMIRKTLKNIINIMHSSKWIPVKKMLLQKKMTIYITHSGFVIFKLK